MGKWQNLEKAFFSDVTEMGIPRINAVTSIPKVDRYIEFDYCNRMQFDKSKVGVHFFEPDYKFERVWTSPDRYGEMLSKFGFIIGPDFSVYDDFPFPVTLYNFYRNAWLTKYWQEYSMLTVVPTVMWGDTDTYDWCFDCYPKHSIVAVSNVGSQKQRDEKDYFENGYNEMLKRLEPTKILFLTRNFKQFDGNVEYIRWELKKGDQLNG